jgi:hypothetical protein
MHITNTCTLPRTTGDIFENHGIYLYCTVGRVGLVPKLGSYPGIFKSSFFKIECVQQKLYENYQWLQLDLFGQFVLKETNMEFITF